MNWLTRHLKVEIKDSDSVLDVGCGLMAPYMYSGITNVTGVDIYQPYLDKAKKEFNVVCMDVSKDMGMFETNSYDHVTALDVIEHIDKELAINLINEMCRVARNKVILYTPIVWRPNKLVDGKDAWGYENIHQEHKCIFSIKELESLGFKCKVLFTDGNIWAVNKLK